MGAPSLLLLLLEKLLLKKVSVDFGELLPDKAVDFHVLGHTPVDAAHLTDSQFSILDVWEALGEARFD